MNVESVINGQNLAALRELTPVALALVTLFSGLLFFFFSNKDKRLAIGVTTLVGFAVGSIALANDQQVVALITLLVAVGDVVLRFLSIRREYSKLAADHDEPYKAGKARLIQRSDGAFVFTQLSAGLLREYTAWVAARQRLITSKEELEQAECELELQKRTFAEETERQREGRRNDLWAAVIAAKTEIGNRYTKSQSKSIVQEREKDFLRRRREWDEEVQGEAHARGRLMFSIGRETDLPQDTMEKISAAAQHLGGPLLIKVE